MDNHIFRSALGGFNRQDVTEYIERTRKEAEQAAERLEEQIKTLQASEAEAREALESCSQEKENLDQQLKEMTLVVTAIWIRRALPRNPCRQTWTGRRKRSAVLLRRMKTYPVVSGNWSSRRRSSAGKRSG